MHVGGCHGQFPAEYRLRAIKRNSEVKVHLCPANIFLTNWFLAFVLIYLVRLMVLAMELHIGSLEERAGDLQHLSAVHVLVWIGK